MNKIFLLFFFLTFFACKKNEIERTEINNNDSIIEASGDIYAVAEIGTANYWKIAKFNRENLYFDTISNEIKLDGFWYGATTISDNKLIVYTIPSIKQIDLNSLTLIKEVPVDNMMFGLEDSGERDYCYAMVSISDGYNFSKVNFETGQITVVSDIEIYPDIAMSPSTIINSEKYIIVGKNSSGDRKIFCFNTQNGNLIFEVDIPVNFSLHTVCGLDYNQADNLIYFLDERTDKKWDLKTLNPVTVEISAFKEGITLYDNVNATIIDRKEQKYIIQNSITGSINLKLVDLETSEIDSVTNNIRIIELNQIL